MIQFEEEQKDTQLLSAEENTVFLFARVFNVQGEQKQKISHTKERALAFLVAFTATGLLVFGTIFYWNIKPIKTVHTTVVEKIKENIPQPPPSPNPFFALELRAKSAIVYDVNEQRVLYGLNEKKQLPLASLTKLMTALLASESMNEKSTIVITPDALNTEGDSGLLANELWDIHDLISFTLISSSNDGADALAASLGSLWQSTPEVAKGTDTVKSFVKKMNEHAKEIGLEKTQFMNPTGLDVPDGGGLGSAEDVSKLLTYIWQNYPQTLLHTDESGKTFISENGFLHSVENTNEIVNTIPGLIGGKTGYTDLAGGNLAVMYDAGLNHPIVVVVLGSTREGRFSDVQKLVNATAEYNLSGWAEYEKIAGSTPVNTK